MITGRVSLAREQDDARWSATRAMGRATTLANAGRVTAAANITCPPRSASTVKALERSTARSAIVATELAISSQPLPKNAASAAEPAGIRLPVGSVAAPVALLWSAASAAVRAGIASSSTEIAIWKVSWFSLSFSPLRGGCTVQATRRESVKAHGKDTESDLTVDDVQGRTRAAA